MAASEPDRVKEDRKDKVLLSLAVLFGGMTSQEIAVAHAFTDVPADAQKRAIAEYKKNSLDKFAEQQPSQPQIQQKMAEISQKKGAQYYRIENPGDGKTCESCQKWIGRVVSDDDSSFDSVQDWMNSGGLHYGCRCSLHLIDEEVAAQQKARDYMSRRAKRNLEARAFNSLPLDEYVFN